MREKIIGLFCIVITVQLFGQERQANDTFEVSNLLTKSKDLLSSDPDSAIVTAREALQLATKVHFAKGEALAVKNIGIGFYRLGKYVEALDAWENSLTIYTSVNDTIGMSNILNNIFAIYYDKGDHEKALAYSLQALELAEKKNDKLRILSALNNIGAVFFRTPATYDKAIRYLSRALSLSEELKDPETIVLISANIGEIYFEKGKYDSAMFYYQKSIHTQDDVKNPFAYNGVGKVYAIKGDFGRALEFDKKALAISEKDNNKLDIIRSLKSIGRLYASKGELQNAATQYQNAVIIAVELQSFPELKDIYEGLAGVYEKLQDYKNAYKYQKLYTGVKDSIYNIESDNKIALLQFDSDLQKKENEISLLKKDNALRDAMLKRQSLFRKLLFAGLGIGLLFILILWRNIRLKQNARRKIEAAYEELKSAQSQLIQSEKMASLGELTAGIAHEIQNPLNFVNNFSEVSNEMMDDLNGELDKGDINEAKAISADIKQNLDKINHHGKRADAIVKGMLQHSRTSSGKKEPTDINALCDEYLRLAFHGLRAKDKSFNVNFEADFDSHVGSLNVVSQDIGRVILNLINNAFYAVNEKKRQQPEGYEPTVSISTKKINDKVEIKVSDNGNGIPDSIKEKIFQPFFTTKPTGSGTGLGLSLSYDIIKTHGGSLEAKSEKGKGTEFNILLPNT